MAKSDDISAEKTEAIEQCLGWIVLALKRQKLLNNALDGLYLPCADRMLWVEGHADTLRCHTSM